MLSPSLSLVPKTLTEMRCHLKNTGKREAKVKFFFVVVFFLCPTPSFEVHLERLHNTFHDRHAETRN